MSDPKQPPGQACGIVNILLPIFLAGGVLAGWVFGHAYGIGWGVLAAAAGFFLGVPALGVFLLVLVGVADVADRIVAWRTGSDRRRPAESPSDGSSDRAAPDRPTGGHDVG